MSRAKAILVNVSCGLGAFAGAGLIALFGRQMVALKPNALAVVAGSFLYLAVGDLLPELRRKYGELHPRLYIGMAAGVFVMATFALYR